MAKYYDIDNDVRINGKLTVNGDVSIPSSFNLLVGGNITGNIISGNSAQITTINGTTANITNINSTGTISGGTIKGNGATLTVNGTTANGGTVPISNGWAYTHENKIGSQGHIPTGGSSTTFLRGDNTWVTPTDTNNYVTGISSTSGGNGTLSVSRNGLTALTLDLSHNHDGTYYTETEVNNLLLGKMSYGDVVMNTNPFGGKKLYINSINNAIFRATERWTVSGNLYKRSDNSFISQIATSSLQNLFNGDYESGYTIPSGNYAIININFNGEYPGYPYGNIYLSHYYDGYSESANVRTYSNYAPHVIGWHQYQFSDYVRTGTTNLITKARNDVYAISQMEFEIHAPMSSNAIISDIDWQLDRPGSNDMPLVDKFKANTLYSRLSFADANRVSNLILDVNGTIQSNNITSTGNITGVKFIGDGTQLTVSGTATSGSSNPISSGWAYTHINTTGIGSHIPTGGTTATFLRGDSTWVTPTDTNNYTTGISSTDGGNGTLTLNRSGLTDLSINLSHNHDSVYYTETEVNTLLAGKDYYGKWNLVVGGTTNGITSSGNVTVTGGGATTVSYASGTLTISSTDTNTWRAIDTSPVSANTANSIASSWAYTHVNTYGLGAHVPSGGSNTTFLRGDNTWVTPIDTNNYLTSLSGGGNGTITANRNGLTALTLDLSHTHSQYVTNNGANQVVLTGFTMSGNAYVGTSSTAGALIVRGTSGASYIQLAGDNSAQQAGVTVYMNASGNANFSATVSANTIKVASTGLVSNLNSEMLNGLKESKFVKNITSYETGGIGVYSGCAVTAQAVPNMTVLVASGIAYTDSGLRVTFNSNSVSLSTASATYDRKDVVYIQGSSANANEGTLAVAVGTPSATPVEPSIPSDAIKLAVVLVPKNIGSIQSTNITDARVWKPLYNAGGDTYLRNNVYVQGVLNSTNGYVQFAEPIKTPSATSVTISAGSTSAIWTHNLNIGTNYAVRLSCNSPEPHVYWTSKLTDKITINLDDVCENDVIVDISLEYY